MLTATIEKSIGARACSTSRSWISAQLSLPPDSPTMTRSPSSMSSYSTMARVARLARRVSSGERYPTVNYRTDPGIEPESPGPARSRWTGPRTSGSVAGRPHRRPSRGSAEVRRRMPRGAATASPGSARGGAPLRSGAVAGHPRSARSCPGSVRRAAASLRAAVRPRATAGARTEDARADLSGSQIARPRCRGGTRRQTAPPGRRRPLREDERADRVLPCESRDARPGLLPPELGQIAIGRHQCARRSDARRRRLDHEPSRARDELRGSPAVAAGNDRFSGFKRLGGDKAIVLVMRNEDHRSATRQILHERSVIDVPGERDTAVQAEVVRQRAEPFALRSVPPDDEPHVASGRLGEGPNRKVGPLQGREPRGEEQKVAILVASI